MFIEKYSPSNLINDMKQEKAFTVLSFTPYVNIFAYLYKLLTIKPKESYKGSSFSFFPASSPNDLYEALQEKNRIKRIYAVGGLTQIIASIAYSVFVGATFGAAIASGVVTFAALNITIAVITAAYNDYYYRSPNDMVGTNIKTL